MDSKQNAAASESMHIGPEISHFAVDGNKAPANAAPHCVIVIGMAGSGKTAFVNRLSSTLHKNGKRLYVINLDPAVRTLPFKCNIDIRDTVNYKNVMKQYQLGPNGAIMTSLNLFATRFDQVLDILEKRKNEFDYFIFDTPGQIEVFNWSASGSIILDSLSVSFPTSVAYIVDTPRCERPASFTSNMLYACSVLYKTKLPFTLVFNKNDVVPSTEIEKWTTDLETFCDASARDASYMASLARSCAITMTEFYTSIRRCSVSSATGNGFDALELRLEEAKKEYLTDFTAWLEFQKKEIQKKREMETEKNLQKFQEDFSSSPKFNSHDAGQVHKSVDGYSSLDEASLDSREDE